MSVDIEKLCAELRAGLESVTPGPWIAETDPDEIGENADIVDAMGIIVATTYIRNAAHIARCSPDNIRALLDALNAADARAAIREAAAEFLEKNGGNPVPPADTTPKFARSQP